MTVENDVKTAMSLFSRGHNALAVSMCENLLARGERHRHVLIAIGNISMHAWQFWRAADLFREAAAIGPDDPQINEQLQHAIQLQGARVSRDEGEGWYLLIKPWGLGFCSDLDHVLGALMLAELTGRTPIIHWAAGSRFWDKGTANAWPAFFEPVSRTKIDDLEDMGYDFFPKTWNRGNIGGPGDRRSAMGVFEFLSHEEDVAVTDTHFGVIDLLPWVPPGTPLAGKSVDEIYRILVQKYLRLNYNIQADVEEFAEEHFAGRRVIAAHARGSDKIVEDANVTGDVERMQSQLGEALSQDPQAKVFLLTDDAGIRASFEAKFGDRLLTTDCARTSTSVGLHYQSHPSNTKLGVEVLRDMYLAAQCERFIGLGCSNVSVMITYLREWAPGAATLLGRSLQSRRNLAMLIRQAPPELQRAVAEHAQRMEQAGGV